VTTIPEIDLSPAHRDSAGERSVALAIDRACREIGFFTIFGHGIDPLVFSNANAALAHFFALSREQKNRYRIASGTLKNDYYTPYGYSGLLEENAFAYMGVEGQPSDYVEKYSTGRLVLNDDIELPFPADQTGRALRDALKQYYLACHGLAARLMTYFALALDLPRDFFTKRSDAANDSLRGHLYPAKADWCENDQGMGAHKDGTLITLLSHTAPGIQVRGRDNQWVRPGFTGIDRFLVNIGDLMAHWTDSVYVSTEHRVILTPEPRQSIAFFKLTNEDENVQKGNRQMDALLGR
jgi:isopenicillin N synthase-like dioxygenase